MKNLIGLFGVAALASLVSMQALATPIATLDRSFVEYTGAGPIGRNNINDNTTFYWFKEEAGTYNSQAVQSWFLFFDPRATRSVTGAITFDTNIIAIMDDKAELIASSPAFGKMGVTYNYSHGAVGLEAGDKAGTSYVGSLLSLDWHASNPGDHIRVLTALAPPPAPTPEPAALGLMAASLAALGLVARRRRAL
jgi:hypothetical protein